MAGPGQLREGSTIKAYVKIASEQYQEQQARKKLEQNLIMAPGVLIVVGVLGYLLYQAL